MIDLDVSERVCDGLIEHGLGYLPPAGIGNSVSIKELITRLRQAEKDAARYRSAVSILGEASEMLQLLSLSASNVSERNIERVDAVVYEIDLELLKCNK